jgi:Ca2+-binding EF-hand superfamily protein
VITLAVRIFEAERNLGRKRLACQHELHKNMDFKWRDIFFAISRGQNYISVADLVFYLEDNKYHPRTEDLEAILRRCDHDADRALSQEEFFELCVLPKHKGGDQEFKELLHPEKVVKKSMKSLRGSQDD